jgi:hypothetical protein
MLAKKNSETDFGKIRENLIARFKKIVVKK